jgi:hypothetical protein
MFTNKAATFYLSKLLFPSYPSSLAYTHPQGLFLKSWLKGNACKYKIFKCKIDFMQIYAKKQQNLLIVPRNIAELREDNLS